MTLEQIIILWAPELNSIQRKRLIRELEQWYAAQ